VDIGVGYSAENQAGNLEFLAWIFVQIDQLTFVGDRWL